MNNLLLILILALFFSALFSGLEIAFVSSDRLRFEMDAENRTFSSRILARFYHNPNVFISTMLVGNNIALVVYSTLMAKLLDGFLQGGKVENEFLIVVIETLVSTAIVLVIGEFVPKTIFNCSFITTHFYLRR